MKKLIILLALILPTITLAQDVFIVEDMVTTKDISVNAYIIGIKGEFDDAVDNFKKFVKEGYDYKVEKENKTTYVVEAVDLPHISVKRGDLKAFLVRTDSMNLMAFSFLLGYDVFLTTKDQPAEMAQFRKFVIDFMDFHYKVHFAGIIELQNKSLTGTKKEIEQDESKISSLKKKVASLAKIKENEEDADKKVAINAERELTENDINELVEQIATLRTEVSKQEKELYNLKQEINKYHLQITSL